LLNYYSKNFSANF